MYEVIAVVMKNWEPLVFLPALAMPDAMSASFRIVWYRWSQLHTQKTGLGVAELEVLILKLVAVDGLSTSAIVVGEVTTLDHEVLNHTVEG